MKIRKILAEKKPIVTYPEDWEKYKNATDCHICNKSLIKDEFLDSLPVWSIEGVEDSENSENSEKYTYCGQWHKKCYYIAKKKINLGLFV